MSVASEAEVGMQRGDCTMMRQAQLNRYLDRSFGARRLDQTTTHPPVNLQIGEQAV